MRSPVSTYFCFTNLCCLAAAENYLKNFKTQLDEIPITKPKIDLSRNEVKALKAFLL